MKKHTGQNGLNQRNSDAKDELVDVVLIGGGVMSATLGTLLQQLEPSWKMALFERLDNVANESSNGWNNAGTGHSALAESNYTPQTSDGEVKTEKAIGIYEQFQLSRQFWAYLVQTGQIKDPSSFITSVPHMSFVTGEKNVEFMRKRYQALRRSPLFDGMSYSEDHDQIRSWIPLCMENRQTDQPVAATFSRIGTDVNFGALTKNMLGILQENENFSCNLRHDVKSLKRNTDGHWQVKVVNNATGNTRTVNAKYVFIGAGGASLTLLQKSGIPEAKGYAGFPVGGQFLVTENPEIVERHTAKVYGKAAVGAPPMSVPHMDTRIIDGKKVLLFGPFASFSTKFLKEGSLFDLFGSVNASNLLPMTQVGLKNFDLVKYLVGQLRQSDDDRLDALKEFFPEASKEDWSLWQAGQRVQIIKKKPGKPAELHLGSELVHAADGSLTALLGASPGASVSAAIMLELLENCFSQEMATVKWKDKISSMIPSYGTELNSHPEMNEKVLLQTSKALGLEHHLLDVETEFSHSSKTSENQYAAFK
ncbi:malate dehydrogenase (quinone) [Vibrio sp.]|nr:malate dehydrogenase (quinone) [Vibrio sp.]